MKEIGGYFGLEQLIKKEYYPNLIALNNARNSLLYIVKAKKINKIYIPYFLCDSISKLCNREGIPYEYYSIDEKFLPVFEKKLNSDEYIYIVNFYGQIDNEQIKSLQEKYGNLIFDNVQAFFQKPIKGIDTIYSCRKFFGVPDGAYLATDKILSEALETDCSKDRMRHILGRFEGNASDYYADFKNNDHSFVDLPLRYMSKLTHNILGAIDYETAITKRNDNYAVLKKALENKNKLNFIVPNAPYAYPFYCENGMTLKKRLAERKIFVATLWPNVLSFENTLEKDYAENILPLPCDQRYGEEEMNYLAEEILKCMKN